MPTKHIDKATWEKVEALTQEINTTHRPFRPIRDHEVMRYLIDKGLEHIDRSALDTLLREFNPPGMAVCVPGYSSEVHRAVTVDTATQYLEEKPAMYLVYGGSDVEREEVVMALRKKLDHHVSIEESPYDTSEDLINEHSFLDIFSMLRAETAYNGRTDNSVVYSTSLPTYEAALNRLLCAVIDNPKV